MMIELRNITLAFGSRTLMRDASARFEAGSMVALLGRNGTGKSTLLRAMAALGATQGGDIVIDGVSLADISQRDLARRIAFVNTERVNVEALTVHDISTAAIIPKVSAASKPLWDTSTFTATAPRSILMIGSEKADRKTLINPLFFFSFKVFEP